MMGLGLVAVGVGCLEFVLDKGQEKDWFGDPKITDFCYSWPRLRWRSLCGGSGDIPIRLWI